MRRIWWTMLLMFVLLTIPLNSKAQLFEFGATLCGDTVNFYCHTVGMITITEQVETDEGVKLQENEVLETWELLWDNTIEREIVMKINRRNIKLKKDDVIAVPCDMNGKNFMNFSPYPQVIDPPDENLIIWDPALLAYAAYDQTGNLVRWGPAVGGKDYCSDIGRSCRTRTGQFEIIRKEGANYKSKRYPVGCTGSNCARMSYAIFFEENYAFHAGNLYAENASHGCVRLFYSDAQWLNKNFVQIGIKVIIKPYPEK